MTHNSTYVRLHGVMVGIGGLIVVISLCILGMTIYSLLNGSSHFDNNLIGTIILSGLGVIIGAGILVASFFPSLIREVH